VYERERERETEQERERELQREYKPSSVHSTEELLEFAEPFLKKQWMNPK
jgi:hypothetical protein